MSMARTGSALAAAIGALVATIAFGGVAYAVGDEKPASSNPLSGDKAAIEAGQTIYRGSCAFCHGMSADGRGRGLPNSADLRKFKRGYSKFVETVKNGYKTMPPWGSMGEISNQEINQIGAYLETQAIKGANWRDKDKRSEGVQPAATEVASMPPPAYQQHLDHVVQGWAETPGGVALLAILEQEAKVAQDHAGYAVTDLQDYENIRLHTRHVRHAIAPEKESSGQGPGKGYGVIRAAKDIVKHMDLVRGTDDAPDPVKTHAEHVIASAGNIVTWGNQILDKAGQVTGGASPVSQAFFAEQIAELTGWILNGHDADNDGTVSWAEGEGGLAQIKEHLGYLAG